MRITYAEISFILSLLAISFNLFVVSLLSQTILIITFAALLLTSFRLSVVIFSSSLFLLNYEYVAGLSVNIPMVIMIFSRLVLGSRNFKVSNDAKRQCLILISMLAVIVLVTALRSSSVSQGLYLIISFCFAIFTFITLRVARDKYPEIVASFFKGCVLGALCSVAHALINADFNFLRLALTDESGGVRSLANALSLALIAAFYFDSKRLGLVQVKSMNTANLVPQPHNFFFQYFIYMFCLFAAFLTISRAVILTSFLLFLSAILYSIVARVKKGLMINSHASKILFFFLSFLAFFVFFFLDRFDNLLFALERLARLSPGGISADGSASARLVVLQYFFETLSLSNLLFGQGAGGFRDLNPYGYYEHSVFISLLYTGGLLLVFMFFLLIICILYGARGSLVSSLPLTIFSILTIALSFSTHGTFSSYWFWLHMLSASLIGSLRRD